MTFHNKLFLGEGMQCFKINESTAQQTLLTRISFILFRLTAYAFLGKSYLTLNVNRRSVM